MVCITKSRPHNDLKPRFDLHVRLQFNMHLPRELSEEPETNLLSMFVWWWRGGREKMRL